MTTNRVPTTTPTTIYQRLDASGYVMTWAPKANPDASLYAPWVVKEKRTRRTVLRGATRDDCETRAKAWLERQPMPALPQAQLDQLHRAIYCVWQSIGYDVLACDPQCDNESCVEGCIDANRLTEYGYRDMDVLLHQLCSLHGYDRVLTYLARHVHLN